MKSAPALLASMLLALAATAAGAYPASFYWANTTLRGDNFQSHNQKIAWTVNGLFRSGQTQTGTTREIIERSTNAGATWTTIYDIGFDNRPATVEADEDANVYVIYPEPANSLTRFLKFSASNNYAAPVISVASTLAHSDSKFASAYDRVRQCLYHATQGGYVFTFDKSGNFVRGQQVFTSGSGARPSYPHLFVDEFDVVHYAMTTADDNDYIPYQTIRYLKSLDGGATWKAMAGTAITIPTTCASNGPSTMINLPGELNYQVWLANMHAKNGKVHFAYQTRNPSNPAGVGSPPTITAHMHYMRFNGTTGVREIDSSPNGEGWTGDTLRINHYSASFASNPNQPTGALYAAGINGTRLNALISYDNGTSWHDYALSNSFGTLTDPGFARAVTPDGKVIGCIATSSPSWATVNYFSLPAYEVPITAANWDGGGGSGQTSWGTAANWNGDVLPTFDNTLDVDLYQSGTTQLAMRTGGNKTIRSLVFDANADSAVTVLTQDSAGADAVLTFDTNISGGSAALTVDSGATGSFTVGSASLGSIALADPLQVSHNGSGTLTIARPLTGTQPITKAGSGTLILSGANTYGGQTEILGGTVVAAHSSALGAGGFTTATMTHIYDGSTLALQGGVSLNEHFHVWGAGTGGLGAVRSLSGNNALVSTGYALRSNTTVGVDADSLTVSGIIYEAPGSYGLTKIGAGTLILSGANTYSGGTTIMAGTLTRGANNVMPDNGDVVVSGTAVLTGNYSDTIANLALNSTGQNVISGLNITGTLNITTGASHDLSSNASATAATMSMSGGSVLRLGANSGNTTLNIGSGGLAMSGATVQFGNQGSASYTAKVVMGGNFTGSGANSMTIGTGNPTSLLDLGGATRTFNIASGTTTISPVIQNGGLAKIGGGDLSLSGSNTYTGNTTIKAGTLKLDGNGGIANSAVVTVGDSATAAVLDVTTKSGGFIVVANQTLMGTGTISGPVVISGTLAPGAAAGTLTAGAVTFGQGSTLAWEIADWTGTTAGTDWDLLAAAGITFNNTNSNKLTIRITGPAANFTESNKTFAIATVSGTITGFDPAAIVIVNPSFGAGIWAVQQTGNSIQLVYTGYGYSPWAAAIPGFTDTAPTHDPDHDGLDNQTEYAFGLDPTDGTGVSPVTAPARTAGTFTYTRRDPALTGLTYVYQYSITLNGGWTNVTPAVSDLITPGPGAGNQTVTVNLTGTPGNPLANAKLFVRVRASAP